MLPLKERGWLRRVLTELRPNRRVTAHEEHRTLVRGTWGTLRPAHERRSWLADGFKAAA